MKTGILKTIATSEAFIKGMMFDCRTCGQCVLTNTAMVCPMSCPKGLRNGPCGGTIDEKCEVYTDKQCVWVRIYKRSKKRQQGTPVLISFSGRRLTKSTGIPKLASETATLASPQSNVADSSVL